MTAPRITPDHPAVIRDAQGVPLPPIADPNGGELLVCWLDELPEGVGYGTRIDNFRWVSRADCHPHIGVFVKASR